MSETKRVRCWSCGKAVEWEPDDGDCEGTDIECPECVACVYPIAPGQRRLFDEIEAAIEQVIDMYRPASLERCALRDGLRAVAQVRKEWLGE